jgi:dihydropteroate synthase
MSFKDTFFSKNRSLNCGGKLLDLSVPRIMGILNVTPDSFYDGGYYFTSDNIQNQVRKMVAEKANIIDIGGISTRPGAKPVSEEEELTRILPAIKMVREQYPETIISVDTYRSSVARHVVENYEVEIINDISGGELDKKMFETAAELKFSYIMMHMRGTPETMQTYTAYEDMLKEIIEYFAHKTEYLLKLGVTDLVIDPGFGFSKTIDQNFYLLNHLDTFQLFELPLMVGISRKSMIYKTLQASPADVLNGTTALNTIALLKGANILRVHDVKAAVQAVILVNKLLTSKS